MENYSFSIKDCKTGRILKDPDKTAKKEAGKYAEFMLHPSGKLCICDENGFATFTNKYIPVFN